MLFSSHLVSLPVQSDGKSRELLTVCGRLRWAGVSCWRASVKSSVFPEPWRFTIQRSVNYEIPMPYHELY
jgi:hypothetical protein